MYESRLTILRVRGIPIGIGASWIVVVALLTWSLSTQLFPRWTPGLSNSAYLAMGLVSALLFFVCIVAHELGHAFRALREGMRIEGITLWLFGGVARFLGSFPSAAAELRIAGAGPIVSVALTGGFGLLAALGAAVGLASSVVAVLAYLAAINLLVVAFNIVPALPLDGGRILRALLWRRNGDFSSATRTAAMLGQAFGVALGAAGLLAVAERQATTGVWLALVGAFIVFAARSEDAHADDGHRVVRRPALGRRRRLVGGGAALAVLVVLGVLWHPPLYVLSPGEAFNVSHDLTITGVPSRVPAAAYLLTTVRADQYSALVDLADLFRAHRELVTTGQVGSIAFQDDMFAESRVLAAAAGAQAAGITVTLTGQGVEVTDVPRGSAASALRAGDVIAAVDQTAVATEFDLDSAVRPKAPGTRVALTVRRAGITQTVTVATSPGGGGSILDITGLTKHLEVAGPFRISFAARNIGGPSAGLAYALAIADALSTGPAPAGTVAATGTIDQTGAVGDVGGVDLKAVGARRQGASLFIVPAEEAGTAAGLIPTVKGVTSLDQALAYLRSVSR